jgi:hypothetical protein
MNKEKLLKEMESVKNSDGGYVYILLADDKTVKIGVTVQPYTRVRQIETASGKTIIDWMFSKACSNYLDIEKSMHDKFKSSRLEGEWFKCSFDKAKSILGKCKFKDIKYIDSLKRCEQSIKALGIVKMFLDIDYSKYNELCFKYHLDTWNENIDDITFIKNMIEEQIESTKEAFLDEADYLNEDRYRYLECIAKGENVRESVQEYCLDYINDLQEYDFAKEILIQYELYELFTRVLGIEESTKNYMVNHLLEKLYAPIVEEFPEEIEKLKESNIFASEVLINGHK